MPMKMTRQQANEFPHVVDSIPVPQDVVPARLHPEQIAAMLLPSDAKKKQRRKIKSLLETRIQESGLQADSRGYFSRTELLPIFREISDSEYISPNSDAVEAHAPRILTTASDCPNSDYAGMIQSCLNCTDSGLKTGYSLLTVQQLRQAADVCNPNCAGLFLDKRNMSGKEWKDWVKNIAKEERLKCIAILTAIPNDMSPEWDQKMLHYGKKHLPNMRFTRVKRRWGIDASNQGYEYPEDVLRITDFFSKAV